MGGADSGFVMSSPIATSTSWFWTSIDCVRLGASTHQEVLVGLAVLWAHDHVYDRVDAGGQIYEDVSCNIQGPEFYGVPVRLAEGDGQIAGDEAGEDD